MSRLDWKRGRFSVDFETNQIEEGLRGRQAFTGDSVDYYRFDREDSVVNDVYDEGTGVGRWFRGPINMPVLHVTHEEGGNQDTDTGFYFNDEVHVTGTFRQLRRTGLSELEIETDEYLKDRFIYDNKVFRVTKILVLGQIQRRDVVVGIDGTQVKPDELVNDQQFAKWSAAAPTVVENQDGFGDGEFGMGYFGGE